MPVHLFRALFVGFIFPWVEPAHDLGESKLYPAKHTGEPHFYKNKRAPIKAMQPANTGRK